MGVRMRKRITMILISLLLIGTIQLTADTIIDSVYADPVLDGYIKFSQNNQNYIVYTLFDIYVGDLGIALVPPYDPNSRTRGYVSFVLPQVPYGYEVDSAYFKLYQLYSFGNDFQGFPIWDVPGGDTMFCIMDHIDYGNSLDTSDWTKGDSGEQGTLYTNIGTISDSAGIGYRYLDITDYVLYDYNNGRDKTQYRIRFPIETDWDYRFDYLVFHATAENDLRNPLIVLYFESNNSMEESCPSTYSISVYPNPFNNFTTISFTARQGQVREVGVYNLKGQLLRTLGFSDSDLGFHTEWDGKDESGHDMSNGIYLIRVESKDVNVIRKVMKIR